jgi:hypothetical protein
MREITPHRPLKPHIDTRKRTKFLWAFDHKDVGGRVSARALFQEFDIPPTTAYRILNDRQQFGEMAESRSITHLKKQKRRGPKGSGRPRVVSNEQLNALINAPKDDRTKKLSTQARKLGIQAHRSTVQRALLELRNAGMRKAALQQEIIM